MEIVKAIRKLNDARAQVQKEIIEKSELLQKKSAEINDEIKTIRINKNRKKNKT